MQPFESLTNISCPNCNFSLTTEAVTQIPPSPVPRILETNVIPTDAEADAIAGIVSETKLILARLDDEISRGEAILSRLKGEREELAVYISKHTALLSPARRVPADVISEIFGHCVSEEYYANPRPVLILGQTCSGWRNALLSTPKLWRSLSLPFPILKSFPLMEIWLSRCGSLPFRLEISSWDSRVETKISDFILLHANRLQSLKFMVRGFPTSVDSVPSFDLLEELHIIDWTQ